MIKKITLTLMSFLLFFSTINAQTSFLLSQTGTDDIVASISIQDFTEIVSFQFSINYDETIVQFETLGLNGIMSEANFNTNIPGVVTIAWFDQALEGVTLEDGFVLFDLHFTSLQTGDPNICFSDQPTLIEVSDATLNLLPLSFDCNLITVTGATITGNVYNDLNDDCNFGAGDEGFGSIAVIANNGFSNLYIYPENDGSYSRFLPFGDYTLSVNHGPYWSTCNNDVPITLSNLGQVETASFGLNAEVDCPLMAVDVGVLGLRRCFENYYDVIYGNIGTEVAEGSYVEIMMPEGLVLNSCTLPYTFTDNLLTVELGDIDYGFVSNFSFSVTPDCELELGSTLCVEAHIYPDDLCIEPYNGPSVAVSGNCDGENINLLVQNTGDGNMDASKSYIVIEDAVMLTTPIDFMLDSGGEIPLSFPANGSTYRLQAQQVDGHPGNSMPSIAIEGCGTNDDGEFSTGFVIQYPEDDSDDFVSIDCSMIVDSFDPNDKRGFPAGYGDESYIKENQEIEYIIRFQNTGTATAFTVIVEDQISDLLDISTIRPGASSHDYNFEIEDDLIRFTFNDINLVDSNVNVAASQGFLKFKIQQQLDLPVGTVINNSAGIFFDFNEAIITNETTHTIGEEFILENTSQVWVPGASVNVYPNPFDDAVNFDLTGIEHGDLTFNLYDLQGRLVQTKKYNETNFTFYKNQLPIGAYVYKISQRGQDVLAGKLMIK